MGSNRSAAPARSAKRSAAAGEHGPLSVPLSVDLRDRLARQANERGLKMATAARVLLDERLRDLEDARDLSLAEEWQRAQAWAVWDAIQAGDQTDVPMDEFRRATERALGRPAVTPAVSGADGGGATGTQAVKARPTKIDARPKSAPQHPSRKR